MFDHVTLRVADHDAALAFYDLVLGTLEIARTSAPGAAFARWADLSLVAADAGNPPARGLHVGFSAPSRAHVDAFWAAGTRAGYADDGPPGPRPQYMPDYYGAFLIDPDGNSAEAGHHAKINAGATIDHLWVRVADVPAAHAFYAATAPVLGQRTEMLAPGHLIVRGPARGSVSFVTGPPTGHVHIAFPAPDHATVDAWHAAALAAGQPDNGAPGPRAHYSAGYYGAFVLDPAGHNVEAVHRDR